MSDSENDEKEGRSGSKDDNGSSLVANDELDDTKTFKDLVRFVFVITRDYFSGLMRCAV